MSKNISRIDKYQDGLVKFLKTKSFFAKSESISNKIINDMIINEDHISAILCLTVLNNQCKKNDIKIHGYYLASGIDALMILSKICENKGYYNDKYQSNTIDNMIIEVVCGFYKCITQNIDTIRLSRNGIINAKLTQLCIEYTTNLIPNVTNGVLINTTQKMKKTDLLAFNINDDLYKKYKQLKMVDKSIIYKNIIDRYGSVCKLAFCLGWLFGQNDDIMLSKIKKLEENYSIIKLEKLAEDISVFLKIYDDFKNIEKDIENSDKSHITLNFVINYGIKEAYIELIEAKTRFIEGSMLLEIETKTIREVIDMIIEEINVIVKDISVDINTQYDDVSTV